MDSSAQKQVLRILATAFALDLSATRFGELLKEGISVRDAVDQLRPDDDGSDEEISDEDGSDEDESDEDDSDGEKNDADSKSTRATRLDLFLSLVDHCEKNPSILADMATQKEITSLRDAALKAFPEFSPEADELRLFLYGTEPTAVIAGLLNAGRINLRDGSSKTVASALEALLKHDFDILRMPVAAACDEWLAGVDETLFQQTKATLSAIQRLAVIVRYPEDMGALLNANFNSAHSIAQMALPSFATQARGSGGLIAEPAKIYSHAASIDFRNDQVTTLMSQQLGTIDVESLALPMGAAAPAGAGAGAEEVASEEKSEPADTVAEGTPSNIVAEGSGLLAKMATAPEKEPKKLPDALKGSTSAASSVLLDMNLPDSPDALSVLSPGAYLVDLLQMLKGVYGDAATTTTVPRDLLTRLLLRRPDIEHLQLSVANQEIQIPYIDLANEVMESIVSYFGDASTETVIDSHDMTAADTEELNLREPQYINSTVYSEFICDAVAPLHQFPYNLALERTRSLMNAFRLSRSGLLEAFCTENTLAHATGVDVKDARSVLETLKAAEQLNLSLDGFAIITGEDFRGEPSTKRYATHELWGYTNQGEMLDTGAETGLYFIEKQLLPRASISFETLVDVIESPSFVDDLHIYPHEPNYGSENPPDLASSLESYRICSRGGDTLTVPSCARLNTFLRLLTKLKWPVAELSQALLALGSSTKKLTIASSILVGLAALSQISQLTGISRTSLLSLWTKSDNPQFASLLRSELELARISGLDDVFADGLTQGKWPSGESLVNHAPIVGACLDMSTEDVERLVASKKAANSLSWEALGVVRRVSLLCKVLKISVADYLQLSLEGSLGLDKLFHSPVETLSFIKRWRSILGDQSAESLLQVLKTSGVDETSTQALEFLRSAIIYFASNKLWPDGSTLLGSPAEPKTGDTTAKAVSSLIIGAVPTLTVPALACFSETRDAVAKTISDGIERSTSLKLARDSPIDGFLFARVASSCVFEVKGAQQARQCKLSFNGKDLALKPRRGNGEVILESDLVELRAESFHELKFALKQGTIKWRVDEETQTDTSFIPRTIVSTLGKTLEGLEISAALVNMMKLDKTEILHFIRPTHGDYLSRLSLLEELTFYNGLKSGSRGLLAFVSSVSQTNATEKLSTQLQSITNWPLKFVEDLLDANHPGVSEADRRASFSSFGKISKLYAQADFMARSNLLKASPQPLIDCAIGELNGKLYDASDKLSSTVRSLTLSSAASATAFKKSNELLRVSRRDALIQYLLQQNYIQEAKIKDADGLFEYFLIDVQMGPNQTTTRIMQAISSTQLFVERCLLNMESGISPSAFDKAQWSSSLGNYRKWEANRKIFLYPENWVDPTLRDNKTELFKEFEVSMAQKQLNGESMLQLVKNYIYGVHDLGSLQIESYYQEERKGNEIRFHLFARTMSSPPRYYYRTMNYTAQVTITPEWSPWQIIQVDVPIYEVDDLGSTLDHPGSYLIPFVWKQQLHLLMPQLVLKPGESGKDKPTSALAVVPQGPAGQSAPAGTKNWGRSWELKLAWTIYRDGAWTPKITSLSALRIEILDADAGKFPDVSSLVFRVDPQPTGLSIYIERTLGANETANGKPGPSILSLGKFVMKGDSLVSQPDKIAVADGTAHSVSFNKLVQGSRKWAPNAASDPWGGATFALPPYQKADTTWDTKWTLSYAGKRCEEPRGLVVAIESADTGSSFTWFHIPHEKMVEKGSNASVRLYNVLDSRLIEAATNAISLKDIFKTLSMFNEKMKIEPPPKEKEAPGKVQTQTQQQKDDQAKKEEIEYSNWDKLSCMNAAYGMHGSTYFKETSTPYAIYNWELGFHMVSLFMERLASSRQYELALEVARLVFDPTIVDEDNENAQWLFYPFRDENTRTQGKTYTLLSHLPKSTGNPESIPQIILDWRRNAFSPHAIARNRPLAYMKRLAMKYVEILVEAGDVEFRKDTLESMPLALQFYVEASHVFGPAPQKIPQVTNAKPQTYYDLSKELDDFGNASVQLELMSPFFVPFEERGSAVSASASSLGFVKARYFTIPGNPEILALRSRIDDRLFKVRNSLDLNGQPRRVTMFGSPIDPRNLIQRGAGGRILDQVVKDVNVSLSRYRFRFLLQKALDLCAELKSLGMAYLTAKERKDSEQMMVTKINQDKLVNDIVLQMKGVQREEACATLEQLRQSRESAAYRLQYFSALTGDDVQIPGEEQAFDPVRQSIGRRSAGYLRMSEEEEMELEKAEAAACWTLLANAMEFEASVLSLIPPISTQAQPWGVGVTVSSPPWGQGALIAASIFKGLSQYEAEQGLSASRVNRMKQQLQERRQQLNQAGLEIKVTDQSMKAQRARISMIDKDIDAHRMQMKNALETMEYLKTKFNNLDLYNYLDRQTMMAFSHTYNLAFELSRHARKAFAYETGVPDTPLAPQDYWDDARGGLLCAENLSMTLRNMELEYLDKSYHDFEIIKHVSLRQIAPLSLLQLRSLGDAKFSISETQLDADFPGHLFRKIMSVSISILCNIGPYTSLNCVLSQEKSSYRISSIPDPKYESQGDADPRFVQVTTPSKHIAISSGQQDTGVFQLEFNDERYMPFEGSGAVSTWNLHFPAFELKQIDFSSISDVIMHVRYTSRDGGSVLKTAAQNSVKDFLGKIQALDKDGSFGLIDLKHDYPIEWHRLVTGSYSGDTVKLDLRDIQERLPFYTKAHTMSVSNVHILFKGKADSNETLSATMNETVFIKHNAEGVIPPDFCCLSVMNPQDIVELKKNHPGQSAPSGGTDVGSWPQHDWTLELKCSNAQARAIREGFLVFSYALAIPTSGSG